MERGALKGHGALLLANVIWGLNSPICKTVLLSVSYTHLTLPTNREV